MGTCPSTSGRIPQGGQRVCPNSSRVQLSADPMQNSNTKRLKPLKDQDAVVGFQFLRCFFWVFFATGVLGFFIAGTRGILIAAVLSVFASMLIIFVTDKLGGMAGAIYGGSRPTPDLRTRFSADLDRVRYQKMHKRFDEALSTVNQLLTQDPDFPDTLFLKAQILFEGFEDVEGAKKCLTKVIEVAPENQETVHRWASTLYHQLTETKHGTNRRETDERR